MRLLKSGHISLISCNFSVFGKCKDIEYLTLVNLLDDYVPLVLRICSIVFKRYNYELYCKSLFHCWIMCVSQTPLQQTLLVTLSLFQHWQENSYTMFETVRQYLVALDKYPVENFHSVLRGRTKDTDTAEQIAFKAKEIDACEHEIHSFKSTFVPERKFNFSSKKINSLKAKAAQFLASKFKSLNDHPNMATQLPRVRRQPKHLTKWKLPTTKSLHLDSLQLNKLQIQPGKLNMTRKDPTLYKD